MRPPTLKIIAILLPLAVFWLPGAGMAADQSPAEQEAPAIQEVPTVAPDLADIVPLAAKLKGRLADLEKKLGGVLDSTAVEKRLDEIDAHLRDYAGKLQPLKSSREYKYNKFVKLRATLRQENISYEVVDLSVKQAIRQLEKWRKEWLAERTLWNQWRSTLQSEGDLDQLGPTLGKAGETIDSALDLVLSRLEAVLAVQERIGDTQEKIRVLDAELEAMIEEERRSVLLDESLPIFSAKFLSQLGGRGLWSAVLKGAGEISWPDKAFLYRQGWIVLLQVFLSLSTIITIFRNRRVLDDSDRWRFLAARPVSAGLFLAFMSTDFIFEYSGGIPGAYQMANTIVGAISFARLMEVLIDGSWKSQFINGVMIVLIATRFVELSSFPLPLFRLYIALAALIGLFFCWRCAGESTRVKDPGLYRWLLRGGSVFFLFIILSEFFGKRALASHLFVSTIRSLAVVLVFILFLYMIRGALEWLFRTSSGDSGDTETITIRLGHFVDIAVLVLVLLPAILMIWGFYDSLAAATKGCLSLGFSLGTLRIDLGKLLVSTGVIYGSFLASWLIKRMLLDETRFNRRLERGARISIARLVHYAVIIAGALFALSILGFEISKITLMLSALGVGIGFGLQGIVNNFVSGLILLFERPVRVGDVIQVTGQWAEIKNIGIRATTVQTFDRADLIIPNADLISNQVTNWTLTNRQIRLIIPVGVAYGSDVGKVTETLLSCAQTNPRVAKRPAPSVLFLSFGESTLDFELRVFVEDFNHRIEVRSALHHQIDRSFRAAGIEIAFPQRDLHLRSADDDAVIRHAEPKTTASEPAAEGGQG